MRRSVTASSAASRTVVDRTADRLLEGGDAVGLAEPLEHLLLAAAEQLRQHPVHDDGGQVDVGLGGDALRQLDGLVDRHLLGAGDDDGAGDVGIAEEVEHPAGLLAHQADLHQLADAPGAPPAGR